MNERTAKVAGAERGRVIAEYLEGLEELTPAQMGERVAALRMLANRARENAAARAIIERLLTFCVRSLPDEAETFRFYYLDGDKRPSDRQAARRLCLDKRSVHRHNRRILEAMTPAAFGVYGVFQTDSERERGNGMTEQEREFCRFCALCIDRPAAALVAGYDPPTAQEAAALLERGDILDAIQREREGRTEPEAAAPAETESFLTVSG